MTDPYDNWLSSPYDDHYDDDEQEAEDDGGEAYERAQQERENPSYMDSPYYDGTGQ